jgi:murein endopeptidase
VLSCLLLATAVADARPQRRSAKQHRHRHGKRAAPEARPRVAAAERLPDPEPQPIDPYAAEPADAEPADRDAAPAPAPAPAPPRRTRGQSIGAPWAGRLQDATRLQLGEGTYLRRPSRAFGTATTVEHVHRAVRATLASFPKAHVLAIGDLSAKDGGWISEHHSHRSGRDIDLGLFYKQQPAAYPASFVGATEDNLDRPATWALLANLLESAGQDGGVQVVFLDYEVQGLLYRWAAANGIKTRILDRIFQYPHGRGSAGGVVRHEPNHDDHLHVRYRCAKADTDCS